MSVVPVVPQPFLQKLLPDTIVTPVLYAPTGKELCRCNSVTPRSHGPDQLPGYTSSYKRGAEVQRLKTEPYTKLHRPLEAHTA